jgi:hypothetical protein
MMESIGERLKNLRLEKGLSLEEAQKKTKININILRAIEGDGLTDLNPVYLKGFIKIYSKFLGFEPGVGTAQCAAPAEPQKTTASLAAESTSLFRNAKVKLGPFGFFDKIKTAFVFVLIIIIVSFILLAYLSYTKKKLPRQIVPLKQINLGQDTQTKTAKETIFSIRLGVRARENCWVSLKVDGRLVFQKILEKGRYESWQAKDKMELSLGSAGAVELEVNGQIFSKLGKKGQVLKNILITKEGLSIK